MKNATSTDGNKQRARFKRLFLEAAAYYDGPEYECGLCYALEKVQGGYVGYNTPVHKEFYRYFPSGDPTGWSNYESGRDRQPRILALCFLAAIMDRP